MAEVLLDYDLASSTYIAFLVLPYHHGSSIPIDRLDTALGELVQTHPSFPTLKFSVVNRKTYDVMNTISKYFPNATNVEFDECYVRHTNIEKLCANAQTIQMTHCQFIPDQFSETAAFENLVHLKIYNPSGEDAVSGTQFIIDILPRAPNLRVVHMDHSDERLPNSRDALLRAFLRHPNVTLRNYGFEDQWLSRRLREYETFRGQTFALLRPGPPQELDVEQRRVRQRGVPRVSRFILNDGDHAILSRVAGFLIDPKPAPEINDDEDATVDWDAEEDEEEDEEAEE